MIHKSMESAPPWILDKAVKDEIEINWNERFEKILESDVPVE